MSVMIRSLSDDAGLFFIRISGFSDAIYAADEVYYVVDLRPAEFTLTVETSRPFEASATKAMSGSSPSRTAMPSLMRT
jgi:hypothetical protein